MRRADGVAMELDDADAVDDPDDTRWTVREAPCMLAEALEAGAHRSASGTMTLTLSNASGAMIADGEAIGTFTNTDGCPARERVPERAQPGETGAPPSGSKPREGPGISKA